MSRVAGHENSPSSENGSIDPNVFQKLPEGSRVLSIESHGISFWGSTYRIDTELVDGSPRSFFMKVLPGGERARDMVRGEFESMKAIYAVTPDFAPKPLDWGPLQLDPDQHFFFCEYRDMISEMPDPDQFAARLAALHSSSVSPTGRFGFHVEDSWEVFFAKSLRHALDLEIQAKGPDPELDRLAPVIFERVIPRLLRPLESEGRSVQPALVHGDLWYANSGVDVETNQSLVYEACCFYAHNEYEFGQWRPICNRFGEEYLAAYRSYIQVSEPEEDYEGRLDLYKLRFNTHVSALFTDNEGLRVQMLGDMKDLIQRYGQDLDAKPLV